MASQNDIDLTTMSKEELMELRLRADKAIADFEARQKREALAALEATAKQHGFKLKDLLEDGSGRKKTVSVAKYVNPEDSSKTWTGKGRQPTWIKERLENGQSLEDFLIGGSDTQDEDHKQAA